MCYVSYHVVQDRCTRGIVLLLGDGCTAAVVSVRVGDEKLGLGLGFGVCATRRDWVLTDRVHEAGNRGCGLDLTEDWAGDNQSSRG